MPKLFANSPNAAFSILQIHPNTSKYVLKQSCELDTKITANGSWSSLFTHVDTFRGFSKDVWTKWCQSLLSETLRQPRAVLAVDAILSGPFLAVSMEVFVTKFKTVAIACEARIEHGDWQLVDHFSCDNLHTPSNYWHSMQGPKHMSKQTIKMNSGYSWIEERSCSWDS